MIDWPIFGGIVLMFLMVFTVGLISVLLGSELFLMGNYAPRDVGDVLFLFTGLAMGMVIIFVFSY